MAIRSNHYDAAFEEYLRARRVPYVAVDEQRRSLLADASLKSFDFIVTAAPTATGEPRPNLLVDVKGRRFPGAGGSRWESWATAEDVECLLHWERVFGDGFRAALVFAYDLGPDAGEPETGEFAQPFEYRDRRYAFFAVFAEAYRGRMRRRSAAWDTVHLPRQAFAEVRSPVAELL